MKTQSTLVRDLTDPGWREREAAHAAKFLEAFPPRDDTEKHLLATRLEVIYIENHPDRRASGWSDDELINWGLYRGLITHAEAQRVR